MVMATMMTAVVVVMIMVRVAMPVPMMVMMAMPVAATMMMVMTVPVAMSPAVMVIVSDPLGQAGLITQRGGCGWPSRGAAKQTHHADNHAST